MAEIKTDSIATGSALNAATWDDFVTRLHHDCEGDGVDDHCTADAIFIVQAKRLVSGFDSAYTDDLVCFLDDSKWFSPEDYYNDLDDDGKESLDKVAIEEGADSFLLTHSFNQWEILGALDSHYVVGYQWEWVYVNAHFTKDAAEAFIRRKKHDYPDGIRVYVDSQYHAWEYNTIKKAILSGQLVYAEAAVLSANAGKGDAERRYEIVRKMNVHQFTTLFKLNIAGEGRFDDLVDHLGQQAIDAGKV